MQSKNGMTSPAIPFFASGGRNMREVQIAFFVFLCKKPLHPKDAAAVNGKYFTKMGREN